MSWSGGTTSGTAHIWVSEEEDGWLWIASHSVFGPMNDMASTKNGVEATEAEAWAKAGRQSAAFVRYHTA